MEKKKREEGEEEKREREVEVVAVVHSKGSTGVSLFRLSVRVSNTE